MGGRKQTRPPVRRSRRGGPARAAAAGLPSLLGLLAAAALPAMVSCQLPGVDALPEGQFWAKNLDRGTWYVVQTDPALTTEGTRCRIYLAAGLPEAPDADALRGYAEEFDEHVYPAVTSRFGRPSDVDRDGRITVLILDIIDGASGGGEYIAGYFHAVNEFERSSLEPYRYSNERDMLYLDYKPAVENASTLNLTLAHELQHLVNFNQKVFVQGSARGQDTWINEGLSSAAEYVYRLERGETQPHVVEKIGWYNQDVGGGIAGGASFVRWTGSSANYATAYLFFQWLRIHSSDGQGVYRRILESPSGDYTAVVDATRADIADRVPAGDARPDESAWERTLRCWYVANLFYNPSGLYGYGSDLPVRLEAPLYSGSPDLALGPGEGVLLAISGEAAVLPAGNIAYAGLSPPAAIDLTSAYTGDYLVAYNRNGDEDGRAEPADTGLASAVVAPRPATVPRIPAGDRALDAVIGAGRTPTMIPRSLER